MLGCISRIAAFSLAMATLTVGCHLLLPPTDADRFAADLQRCVDQNDSGVRADACADRVRKAHGRDAGGL